MTKTCIHSICLAAAVLLVGSTSVEAATHIVTITATQDFGTLNIAFGDTVIWRTTTGVSHNAIACVGVGANPTREQVTACSTSGGRFATATVASPGGTVEVGRVTFSLAGDGGASYPYKCTIHASFMHGKIVAGADAGARGTSQCDRADHHAGAEPVQPEHYDQQLGRGNRLLFAHG